MATAFARMGLWVKISKAPGEAAAAAELAIERLLGQGEAEPGQKPLEIDFTVVMESWPTKPPKFAGAFAYSKGQELAGLWNLHPLFSGSRGSGTRVDIHAVPLDNVPVPAQPDVDVAEALLWIASAKGQTWLAATEVLTYFLVTFEVQV